MIWVRFPFVHLIVHFFKLNFFLCLFSCGFFKHFLLSILMAIISLETDEGQLRPKYIFNKCRINIYFLYSTEVWSITITEF